jgi:hypothetical protein
VRDESLFCTPTSLFCPEDSTVLGYPWALLPNGTDVARGLGFDPVRVTQWPPPGTPLWRDTTTQVVITAYDAGGGLLNCTWHVHVPPLVELGTQYVGVRRGTFTQTFRLSGLGLVREGLVFTLRARLRDPLHRGGDKQRGLLRSRPVRGAGTSITALLRDRNHKHTGRLLTIRQNEVKAAGSVPGVHVTFSQERESDVTIHVQVTENGQGNLLAVTAHGQIKQYF